MEISARIHSNFGEHLATLTTDGQGQSLDLPAKASGPGIGLNGGELLFLALATCYGNDIYREAAKRGIEVTRVEVDVRGKFGDPGEPATNIRYSAMVTASVPEAVIVDLMRHTDTVAEIHNTLRAGASVELVAVTAITTD